MCVCCFVCQPEGEEDSKRALLNSIVMGSSPKISAFTMLLAPPAGECHELTSGEEVAVL